MPRRHVAVFALSLTALFALVLAGPASAAKRKVPFGFYGAVLGDADVLSSQALNQSGALMARNGVESVRVTFSWAKTESAPGQYDWRITDAAVREAASHGLQVLGNVMWTPRWASSAPSSSEPAYYYRYSPNDPAAYAAFARQLVLRYGPHGTFWAENAGLPKLPIRRWQLWNEPMITPFWSTQPWPSTFVRLLRAAYPAIKGADKGAAVVLAAVVSAGPLTQWAAIRKLYQAGAKKYFDQASINLFTNDSRSVKATVARVLDVVRRVRAEMSRYGDARKKVRITELTWAAAKGKVPSQRLLGFETTPKGQAQRLTASYAALAKYAGTYKIAEVDWYAWATQYDTNSLQSDVSFRFTGLTRLAGGGLSSMPILKTYAKSALTQEGCRKGSDARRCDG